MRKAKALQAIASIQGYVHAIATDVHAGQPLEAANKLYELGDRIHRLADQLHLECQAPAERRDAMRLMGRIGLMGLMFLIGAALAIAVVILIGWVNAFRAWFIVALLLTVVFLFGLAGSTPRPATKRELRFLPYSEADALIRSTNGAWTIAKEEDGNPQVGMVYLERVESDGLQEEITRRSRISKTK